MSIPIQFAQDLVVRKAFSAAGHSVLVYDYFLTLNDEILYIWNAPWTFVKVMFLVNRYGNLLGQTFIRLEEAGLLTNNSQKFCRSFVVITAIYMLLSSETIHILVLMRAWAIWGTGKRTTRVLIWSYIVYLLIQMAGALITVKGGHISHFRYLDYANVCFGGMPNLAWLSYLGSFVLDILLLYLTMRSLRKYCREFRFLYPSGLLRVLVRDALLFFTVSMLTDVLTIASWTAFAGNPKYFLGKGFAIPLLSVAGQRLVLNLRGLQTRTYETRDLSREVNRQLQAFEEDFHAECPPMALDNMGDPEGAREACGSENKSQD